MCDNFPLLVGVSGPLIGFLSSAHSSVNSPFVQFFSVELSELQPFSCWDPDIYTSITRIPSLPYPWILPQASEILFSPRPPLQTKLSILVASSHHPFRPSLSHYHQNLKVDPVAIPRTMFTQAPAPLLSAVGRLVLSTQGMACLAMLAHACQGLRRELRPGGSPPPHAPEQPLSPRREE